MSVHVAPARRDGRCSAASRSRSTRTKLRRLCSPVSGSRSASWRRRASRRRRSVTSLASTQDRRVGQPLAHRDGGELAPRRGAVGAADARLDAHRRRAAVEQARERVAQRLAVFLRHQRHDRRALAAAQRQERHVVAQHVAFRVDAAHPDRALLEDAVRRVERVDDVAVARVLERHVALRRDVGHRRHDRRFAVSSSAPTMWLATAIHADEPSGLRTATVTSPRSNARRSTVSIGCSLATRRAVFPRDVPAVVQRRAIANLLRRETEHAQRGRVPVANDSVRVLNDHPFVQRVEQPPVPLPFADGRRRWLRHGRSTTRESEAVAVLGRNAQSMANEISAAIPQPSWCAACEARKSPLAR